MDEIRDPSGAWGAAHGGLRGSTLLRIGAVLAALSILLESTGVLLAEAAFASLSITAWTGWTISLIVLGLGFIWVGLNPPLSRFGIVVGVFHLVHAVYLLLQIFTNVHVDLSPKVPTVIRLALVLVFAFREREPLGRRTALFLGAMSVVVLAKALLPLFGIAEQPGTLGRFLLDTVPALLLILALLLAAGAIRHREDSWAAQNLPPPPGTFEDFNNPFHEGLPPRGDPQK